MAKYEHIGFENGKFESYNFPNFTIGVYDGIPQLQGPAIDPITLTGCKNENERTTIYNLSVSNCIPYALKNLITFFWKKRVKIDLEYETISIRDSEDFDISDFLEGEIAECRDCGEYKKTDAMRKTGDEYVCEDCYYSGNYYTCEDCGEIISENDVIAIHSSVDPRHDDVKYVCDSCADDYYKCSRCGDYFIQEASISDDNITLCYHCYENNYCTCESCSAIINTDDSVWSEQDDCAYCRDCAPDENCSGHIHEHWCKLKPIFHGDGLLFFGIELETDTNKRIDKETIAENLFNLSDDEKLFYLEKDGSLNNGIEIISRPYTLEKWQEYKEIWKNVCKICVSGGLLSHDIDTTGLHIHVSKKYFSDHYEASKRLIYLYEKYFTEFKTLSRRTFEQLGQWCKRMEASGRENVVISSISGIDVNMYDRYKAINFCNSSTIEFRFFRGTLNINTVMASIQLVNNLCYFAENFDNSQIQGVKFEDIIQRNFYPELIEYAQNKKLIERETIDTVAANQ